MPINFPTSPTVGQTFTAGNIVFEWNGSSWVSTGTPVNINAVSQSANVAMQTANAAFTQANAALAATDTTWVKNQANSAFVQANSAFIHANAAFDSSNTKLSSTGGTIEGNIIITGNLTVQGDEFITQTKSLAIKDNMIFLNNEVAANISNAVGNGTHIIYTTTINHGYDIGEYVVVNDVNPSTYNISDTSNTLIANVTSNTFTVVSSNTGAYVSGGVARGRTAANPDLGFSAAYNDGTYLHAGFFRDASDGTFKVFHNYVPEPDTSIYIDTNDPSFRIANLTANIITDVITVRGVDPLLQANNSYNQANAAFNHANAAFNKANISTVMFVAVSDETTAITAGTAKITFRSPFPLTVTNVRASLSTASTSGNVSLTIKENGASILNGRVWIDVNEKTSTTSGTIPSINDGVIADDAEITIDIDDAGSGAKGLKVALIYTV
jgi:hypothetical protein